MSFSLVNQSVLARTQNEFTCQALELSEEILSEIFMAVVYGPNDSEMRKAPSVVDDVRMIYRRVYRLLGVCAFWRDIVLNRGALWAVVPTLPKPLPHDPQPFQLSLQRARGCILHLAADTMPPRHLTAQRQILEVLAEYSPRFHTVNLHTIRGGIGKLLQHEVSYLTELSILLYDHHDELFRYKLPNSPEYVFPHGSPQNDAFIRLTSGLVAFRVSGTPFYWEPMLFSTRLAEFRVDNLVLGYDTAISPFLQTLSSASGLRDLKIISIVTFRNSSMSQKIQASPPVVFPNLEQLLLQDMHHNTLRYLVPLIAPGSYSLTLSLGSVSLYNCLEYDEELEIGAETVEFSSLCRILAHIPVYTLMISTHQDYSPGPWVTGVELRNLLEIMLTMKRLKINRWYLGTDEKMPKTASGGSTDPQ